LLHSPSFSAAPGNPAFAGRATPKGLKAFLLAYPRIASCANFIATLQEVVYQCPFSEWPSSLLLVANKMHAVKTAMMTGTTTNGEVMCIGLGSLLVLE
jgi:hypothetical protein